MEEENTLALKYPDFEKKLDKLSTLLIARGIEIEPFMP
jgi:hypothetical protein